MTLHFSASIVLRVSNEYPWLLKILKLSVRLSVKVRGYDLTFRHKSPHLRSLTRGSYIVEVAMSVNGSRSASYMHNG